METKNTKPSTKRTVRSGKGAHYVVVALVIFAVACDVARWAWHHAQAHPVQFAQWLLGATVVAIIAATVLLLKLED